MSDKSGPAAQLPPDLQLTQLGRGFMLSQVILTAGRLEIDRLLGSGAKTLEELAKVTGTVPRYLQLVMRILTGYGVFEELPDGRFVNGPQARYLWRSTVMSGPEAYSVWGELLPSLKTGEPGFPRVFGKTFFEYLASNPPADQLWNRWNAETASEWLPPVIAACDFSEAKTIVDVGGGQGTFIAEVLKRNKGAKGVLYDLPNVVAGAVTVLESAGLVERCTVIVGSFFDSVPEGGDVYCISRVLFNWDDEQVLTILRNCRRAMKGRERLVIVENLLPSSSDPGFTRIALNSLNLWLMFGSRHRTAEEYRQLLDSAGFKLLKTIDVPGSMWKVLDVAPK
jgi:hypothetical protein